MRILLVEDNSDLVVLVTKALAQVGLDADAAGTVAEAEVAATTMRYAAIVLDLGLPDADGLELIDHLRRLRDPTPILIISARDALDDRVAGLHRGASDYLTKPFAMAELVARVQALLRRAPEPQGAVLRLGNVSLDTASRLASVDGKALVAPARETMLLELLLKRSRRTIPHAVLQGQFFDNTQGGSSNAIEVYVHRLRRLLADAGATIQIHTIRGVGYLLEEVKGHGGDCISA